MEPAFYASVAFFSYNSEIFTITGQLSDTTDSFDALVQHRKSAKTTLISLRVSPVHHRSTSLRRKVPLLTLAFLGVNHMLHYLLNIYCDLMLSSKTFELY